MTMYFFPIQMIKYGMNIKVTMGICIKYQGKNEIRDVNGKLNHESTYDNIATYYQP
jgi:hypothetical protein